MKQLITPNPHIPCQPGWCLQYVRQAYGLPPRHPTATAAWEASGSKHRDRNFPKGVWLPVWFSLANEPAGHVALMAPDGSVYSTSDLGSVPHHHPDLSDLMNYYARYGMTLKYLGWTEDVAGYPVITNAGLAPQGTTIEEDFLATLSNDEKDTLFKVLDNIHKKAAALPPEAAFWSNLNGAVNNIHNKTAPLPEGQYWDDLIHAAARIDAAAAAPQLAAQINAAGIAAEVQAELVKLIGGAK